MQDILAKHPGGLRCLAEGICAQFDEDEMHGCVSRISNVDDAHAPWDEKCGIIREWPAMRVLAIGLYIRGKGVVCELQAQRRRRLTER